MSGVSENNPDPPRGQRAVTARLDRAPGERYAPRRGAVPASIGRPDVAEGGRAARGSVRRALAAVLLVSAVGAVVMFGLAQIDLGPGLLVVAATIGWSVSLALIWGGDGNLPDRRRRMALAGGLGAAAVTVGLLMDWAWGRLEGGALDPIAYLDARFGPLAWLAIAAAGLTGALRAR
jgi:hypothetical protein